jgi:hypothetical protein
VRPGAVDTVQAHIFDGKSKRDPTRRAGLQNNHLCVDRH